jgi:FKBP-type peptidyl-prolyl cis-trans isomerase FkpA
MKKIVAALVLLGGVALTACQPAAAPAPSPSPAAAQTEEQKTLYALGVVMAQNLKPFNLSATEVKTVAEGLTDGVSGKAPAPDMAVYGPKFNELGRSRVTASAAGEKQKGDAFATTAAAETGAVKTPSGLVYKTLAAGKGASPAATDTVKVHYRGTLINGEEFDSSIKRGEPVEFKLNQVIPCWTEGVQKMKIGEKAKLVCPSAIAYGDQGRPPQIPGGATLVFEVELLAAKK